MFNIGACLDIPTGTYIKGARGEHILNGGLGALTGVVGIGNNFKSTLMHYMMLTAMSRFAYSIARTYDTEINIHEWHLKNYKVYKTQFNGADILDSTVPSAKARWTITDKTLYTGDEFFDKYKDFLQNKRKEERKYTATTPFLDRDGKSNMKMTYPTFTEIDSMSEFVTKDVIAMQDDNSLGESGGNTVSMRQGLQKNRFLMEIPGLANGAYDYVLLSAHMGDEFNMDPRNPKPRKLQHLPMNLKIKGVPEKFTFVMNNCWHAYNAAPLKNDSTKAPEYPRNSDDDLKGDTDLCVVMVKQLRSKSGVSGTVIPVVVSQEEGVLESLTEFHHIKENGRFGIEGTLQNYYLVLCPEIKLSRTTVRGKIDKHPELRRALTITSELCQIHDLWHHLREELYCTPKQLYEDLIKIGYDWKLLLNTRGWWTTVEDETTRDLPPFLSTMDLMLMRVGRYVPYWYPKDLAAKLVLPNVPKGELPVADMPDQYLPVDEEATA